MIKNRLREKKGAIGQTITWLIATIIIVLMVFLFIIISVGFAQLKADDEEIDSFRGAYADTVEFENLLKTKLQIDFRELGGEIEERTIREWYGVLGDEKNSKEKRDFVKEKISHYFVESIEKKQNERYFVFVQFESDGYDDIFEDYSDDFFVFLREQGHKEVIVENLNKKESVYADEYFFLMDSSDKKHSYTIMGKEGFTKERVDLTKFGFKTIINGKKYILTYYTIMGEKSK